jgi:hypothetical protein
MVAAGDPATVMISTVVVSPVGEPVPSSVMVVFVIVQVPEAPGAGAL